MSITYCKGNFINLIYLRGRLRNGGSLVYYPLPTDWTIFRIVIPGFIMPGQMYGQHYVCRRQDKTDRYKNKQYFPVVVLHYHFAHTTPVILRKSPSAVKDSIVGISAGAYHKSDTEFHISFGKFSLC